MKPRVLRHHKLNTWIIVVAMACCFSHAVAAGSSETVVSGKGSIQTPKDKAKELVHEGLNHLLLGNPKAAEESFIQAKSIDPYSEEAYNFLGLLYIQEGFPKKAEDMLLKATAIEPMYGEALRNLGKLYLQQEEFKKAAGFLRKTLIVDRTQAYTWYLYGMALYFDSQVEEAIRAYEEAFSLESNLPTDAHYNLGVAYHETSRYLDAAREYEAVLKKDTTNINAMNNLGLIYSAIGDKDKAVGLFKKVLSIDKDNVKARINLGNVYLSIKDLSGAEEIYRSAIDLAPEDISPRLNLGVVHFERGDFDKAKQEWDSILENEPENLRVLSVMGSAYLEKKRLNEAIEVFRRMVPLMPDSGSIANTLGYLLAEQDRELPYAKELVEKALELDKPNRATYLDSLAWIHYRKGEFAEAREIQEKALQIFKLSHEPISSEIHLHMGKIYEKLQEFEKAKIAYEDAVNSNTDPDIVASASESLRELTLRQ